MNRLPTDPTYRAWVIRQINNPFIGDFWANEYAGYDPRFQREVIAPIQNKLGQFLQNPVIRNILGQVRNRIEFRFLIDDTRIFITNLSKGRLGHEKAHLLGSLFTTQFQLAAMARANVPEAERRDRTPEHCTTPGTVPPDCRGMTTSGSANVVEGFALTPKPAMLAIGNGMTWPGTGKLMGHSAPTAFLSDSLSIGRLLKC